MDRPPGADLGCSSDYSAVNAEDRSGAGFPVNSSWTGVSRSLPPRKTSLERPVEPFRLLLWVFWRPWLWGKGKPVKIPAPAARGSEAARQLATVERRVIWSEESSLFSLTSLTP
jgi:hypothetical protein